MQLALTKSAQQDLKSIARHTHERWGVKQRNAYLREIDQAFRSLTKTPLIGRACDDIRAGYRKLPPGSHVIYYKLESDHVLVVRVLHAMMDVETNIGA